MRRPGPYDLGHIARAWSNVEWRVLAISAATALLYALHFCVQRSIFADPVATAWRADFLWQGAGYAVLTAGLFTAYGALLALCRRGELRHGRACVWALLVPCALNLAFIAWAPRLSQDVFSYQAHGFLGVMSGGNPLIQAADAAAHTSIGPKLSAFGWHGEVGITPYGIVWTRIEVAVMQFCGGDVAMALLIIKAIVVAANLATAYLIWRILGYTRPAAQLFGTLAYLWNPLILLQFAGDGHNDALMLLFVIGALLACVAPHPTRSVLALLFGVLSKYVPLLLLPAQIVYLWRTRRGTGRLVLELFAASFIAAAVAALLYRPLWAGWHSFDGLLMRGHPVSSASPFGGINYLLQRSPLAPLAGPLTVALLALPLLVFTISLSARVKDAAGLAGAFAWISTAYVLVASPDYWPWYACMPVALLVVADAEGLLWLIMLMSFVACLGAPLDLFYDRGFLGMQVAKGLLTGLGASLPFAVLLVWRYRGQRRSARGEARGAGALPVATQIV